MQHFSHESDAQAAETDGGCLPIPAVIFGLITVLFLTIGFGGQLCGKPSGFRSITKAGIALAFSNIVIAAYYRASKKNHVAKMGHRCHEIDTELGHVDSIAHRHISTVFKVFIVTSCAVSCLYATCSLGYHYKDDDYVFLNQTVFHVLHKHSMIEVSRHEYIIVGIANALMDFVPYLTLTFGCMAFLIYNCEPLNIKKDLQDG